MTKTKDLYGTVSPRSSPAEAGDYRAVPLRKKGSARKIGAQTVAFRENTTSTEQQAGGPLLLTNIRQLLTLRGLAGPRRGRDLSELGIIEDGAVLCAAGKIVCVGSRKQASKDGWVKTHKRELREVDCHGGVVLPGFVDSHTHPAFTAPRLADFERRIAGASYEEIAAAGGGIRSSIDGVRHAPRTELARLISRVLQKMSQQGTTTVEAKSGYGLSAEAELKSLEAICDAALRWPGTVVATLLGAHVVPPEFRGRSTDYVRLVCEQMIPEAARRKLAAFVDVFCERGAFAPEEARAVFEAATQNGLGVRAHLGQISPGPIQDLLRFAPASIDHLDYLREDDIARLAKSNTIATLLPASNYFLGLTSYAPARKLIEGGVAVALATDYNPGTAPTPSMPFVLSLACTQMKMSPAEAITAATVNGAYALRLGERKGSIEPGKDADLAIFDVRDFREIPYWIAATRCAGVVMNGELVGSIDL